MFTGELYITNGTTKINLLSERGFHMVEWIPQRSAMKGGGAWVDSPLLDGRQLVYFRWGNIIDQFVIENTQMSMGSLIRECQEADRLLLEALSYWQSNWSNTPVYLVARAASEASRRYAIIHSYSLPHDADPYSPPFMSQFVHNGMTGMELNIEHGPWLSEVPGTATGVETSTAITKALSWSQVTELITNNNDNGQIYDWQDFDNGDGSNRLFVSGLFSSDWAYSIFARWQSVSFTTRIIDLAVLTVGWNITALGDFINLRAYMSDEDDDTTSPTSYQTFMEKTRTTAFCPLRYCSAHSDDVQPSAIGPISTVLQEVIDRSGWVQNNDLILLAMCSRDGNDIACIDNFTGFGSGHNLGLWARQFGGSEVVVGRGATTERETYVANHYARYKRLFLIYRYDSSTTTFSANLASSTAFSLFPNPMGVDDCIYFSLENNGPGMMYSAGEGGFYSLVFDLGTIIAGGDTAQFEWEYYDGGAWSELPVDDQTALFYGSDEDYSWRRSGVCSVSWTPPSDWSSVLINGGTYYWIRCRLTANVPAAIPAQQNRVVYTQTEPYVTIAADQIEGDLSALARVSFRQEGGRADKVVMAMRSTSRGADFCPYLNFSWSGNPEGIAADGPYAGASVAPSYTNWWYGNPEGATGTVAVVNLNDIENPQDFYMSIPRPMTLQYTGAFRAFIRLKCTVAEESFSVTVHGETYYHYRDVARQFWQSDAKYVNSTEWVLVDLGKVVIPPTEEGAFDEIIFRFDFSRNGGNPLWVYLQDFILMPVDEWAGEFNAPTEESGLYGDSSERITLVIDSISNPKRTIEAHTVDEEGVPVASWETISNGPIQLQCRSEQRVFFLSAYYDDTDEVWVSEPWPLASVKVEKMERYRGMRGID